jgi:hypothetical protein
LIDSQTKNSDQSKLEEIYNYNSNGLIFD